MGITKQRQIAELAKIVDRFLELKPEYSGAFWDSMQFAEFVMEKFEKIEEEFNVLQMEKEAETQEKVPF